MIPEQKTDTASPVSTLACCRDNFQAAAQGWGIQIQPGGSYRVEKTEFGVYAGQGLSRIGEGESTRGERLEVCREVPVV